MILAPKVTMLLIDTRWPKVLEIDLVALRVDQCFAKSLGVCSW